MFVSLGPQRQQYNAYKRSDHATAPRDGTTGEPTKVTAFYRDTRRNWFGSTYSLVSGVVPLLLFGSTVWLVGSLIGDNSRPPRLTDNQDAPQLPTDAFCHSPDAGGPLLNDVFAATVHFAVTHAALAITCLFALVVGTVSARNVLNTHRYQSAAVLAIAFVLPIALGLAVFFAAQAAVGNRIAELFARLYPITVPSSDCGSALADVTKIKDAVYWWVWWGALAVSIVVSSLVVAAACFAYRYETNDINGAWSDSYVLRHKLNSLLTLFFVASILLVVINVALTSAMDWSGAAVDAVSRSQGPNAQAAPPTAPGDHMAAAAGEGSRSDADAPSVNSIQVA